MRIPRLLISICAWMFLGAASAAVDQSPISAELDLGSMVRPVPADWKFSDPGYHVWCGAPILTGDGKCHLFYSRWPVSAGFHPGWALRSEIAYAVAEKLGKPFKFVNIALPPRGQQFWDGATTHNPNIIQKDGKFYLFYMGNTGDGTYTSHRNNQRIGLATADRPEGPWRRFERPIIDISTDKRAFDSLCVTNPAATVRPDGGILLIYKAVEYVDGKPMGGRVRYGAALADRPGGPYVKTSGRIFEGEDRASESVWMLAEDPYIWFSRRYGNRYCAVARDVVGRFTGSAGGLALFESADGLKWEAAAHPKVLGNKFTWIDGALSRKNVERPALLLDGERPVALFGATDGYLPTPSFNVQIPLVGIQ